MHIDNIDKFLIEELQEAYKDKQETTTRILAKKLSIINSDKKLDSIENRIRARLKSYVQNGFALSIKNGKRNNSAYLLVLDIVRIIKYRYDDGYRKAILIRM